MFHFPPPGWRSDPPALVLSQADVYRLLIMSAPALIASGESQDTDDPLNDMLVLWWSLNDDLVHDLRLLMQKTVRDGLGALPASPWTLEGTNDAPAERS